MNEASVKDEVMPELSINSPLKGWEMPNLHKESTHKDEVMCRVHAIPTHIH